MKNLSSCFICLLISCISVSAQVPRLTKYQINETGRYAYYPSDPGYVEPEKSDDGSDVYTLEVEFAGVNYGTIMVDFADGMMNEVSKEELETMLTSYLDFLQGALKITGSAGYGMGHTLESNPDASGVIDYWEDEEGRPWVIKGWVDKNTLAVMYIYAKELPADGIQSMFLNGFRFN